MRTKAILRFLSTLAVTGFVCLGATAPSNADPVDFLHDVMPVVSKLGCNALACHGSQKGKAGLAFSMFGADPQSDYEALAKADGGRRVNKVEPTKSLFLLKATGGLPHAMKQKLPVDSARYNLLATWVAQGALLSRENGPQLVSIEVSPKERILRKGEAQQLSATAIFSDGSRKDVTPDALFISTDAAGLPVDESGKVTANNCGESVIVVTYLRQPATARIIVPQQLPGGFPRLAAQNKIDELVDAKLKVLGIPPSELCLDHEFLRRVYLDVTGTLPTADEARAYLADQDPQKRVKTIDRLLASEEFADYWAMKWCDLFRVKSEYPNTLWPNAVQAYHRWVRMSIDGNMPYDQFVRELLVSSGSNFRAPPANFYRAFLKKDAQNVAEVSALIFMGARVGCARCHGHPTENWGPDDNLGLAAFFAQLRYKSTTEWKEEIVYLNPKQNLARVREDRTKANAEYAAAERAAKEAEAVAKAKIPAAKTAAAKAAAAAKTAVQQRKIMAAAKTRRDQFPRNEKAALARLAESNRRVEAAKTAARQRRDQGFQDLLWALLNTKEFVFNH